MKYLRILAMFLVSASFVFTACNDEGGSGGGGTGDSVITIAAIPGVVVPVRDAAPVTTAIDTDQYTGTISWSPADDPFAAETVYTATITLTAKAGNTLTGVAENFFTVAGATATNAAGSGVVTAVFPATAAVPDIDVVFQSAVQTGGTDGTANTTGLTLTFSVDPTNLTAANITVTGATKGTLTGSSTTRSLTISNITVANGETVSVTITSPAGYSITGSPKTAVVYKKYNLRDTGPAGGLIFYDKGSYSDGWRFLEAAPEGTDSTSINWGTSGYWVENTSVMIGSGEENTGRIIDKLNDLNDPHYRAAQYCDDFYHGGYNDWFLPSKGELNKMYENLKLHGVGGFVDQPYWSSSEVDASQAWLQDFTDGNQWEESKLSNWRVRAVRAF